MMLTNCFGFKTLKLVKNYKQAYIQLLFFIAEKLYLLINIFVRSKVSSMHTSVM